MTTYQINAEPYPLPFDPASTALVMIDMQRDFVEPGGFGEMLGNDVSLLRSAIEPCRKVLETARKTGIFVIHTREGHRPDLSDLPAYQARSAATLPPVSVMWARWGASWYGARLGMT